MPNISHPDYPEEYKSGKVIFFGREFIISPDVLIPRLETEGLVRRARKHIREKDIQILVDIGTGSGIIGVSCADLVDEVVFIDISSEALKIAEHNFRTYFPEKEAQFSISDLLAEFPKSKSPNTLLVANLPYIKAEDWEHMSADTHFEPELALFGGERTGFEIYERLFAQILESDLHGTLIIEFGFDQREVAEKIIASHGWNYEFFPDYAGIERFAEIQF